MARVKLNQPVNADGTITTCAELLDAGKAIVERVDNFGKNMVVKYFCTLLDDYGNITSGCFEIGQKAYESRVAKGQHVKPVKTQETTLQTQETPITLEGEWDQETQSFVAVIGGDDIKQVCNDYDVFVIEPNMDGTKRFTVNYMPKVRKTVTIPSREAHEGIYSIDVSLYWFCPKCGKPRGELFDTVSYDGSRRLHVNGWSNACGHVDKYADVRQEALELQYSSTIKR